MTETIDMQPTEAEAKARRWVVRALDDKGFANVLVEYAWQAGNVSGRPYAQVEILSDRALTDPEECVPADEENSDGTFPVYIDEQREIVVQVSCYGSLAYHMARAIDRSLRRRTVTDANRNDHFEVQEATSPILNIPEPQTTHFEPRRVQDFRCTYAEVTKEKDGAGVLESVEVDGPVDEVDGSFDASISVSWPTP